MHALKATAEYRNQKLPNRSTRCVDVFLYELVGARSIRSVCYQSFPLEHPPQLIFWKYHDGCGLSIVIVSRKKSIYILRMTISLDGL